MEQGSRLEALKLSILESVITKGVRKQSAKGVSANKVSGLLQEEAELTQQLYKFAAVHGLWLALPEREAIELR